MDKNTSKTVISPQVIIAEHRQARISAFKARMVARLISKLKASDALDRLTVVERKSSHLIEKVLKSAIANAVHNFGLREDDLIVKKIEVGEGPTLKRFRARSRGMASRINKRTSNIKIYLEAKASDLSKKKESKKEKAEDSTEKVKNTKKTDTKKALDKKELK
ncbi:50S ribosomal protein L22 [candidate division CPR3 bacterium GWF2_35_18]|uniref:Large ribosomal subunit protein uL22 n=1 Tax=candidate division CPR3 bacterium GW2011_GWF2_35_18 TaxID=1618350 RepID=A0A0G0BJT6_UNCC3|nr:MAG: 50S ribosomal protein L22 [candidate division CPR3 bacterium GW2011_GWF2_35_18]KKP86066.1 MAG: 50S ribosomal protein L22 [candidate division CPR3 bacterium GW2011_GWE2_35_7]OGB63167.1 MAG: 50S ribosomal protein L22 [candidate division CPR3 bacterium GWF2_35_18]OGB64019.1 MAG: 50S ribosomal protein L22 [candidate division CPR3 bacterium RIFOXYA2_FULL_35_13]OGB79608.1 MAG: 50S ribosomal protein L22 [candidate division CPR3 bacterium RIFOXYB2_FULL_35_8]OGB80151.1 MAG: 50S ribosomal protei